MTYNIEYPENKDLYCELSSAPHSLEITRQQRSSTCRNAESFKTLKGSMCVIKLPHDLFSFKRFPDKNNSYELSYVHLSNVYISIDNYYISFFSSIIVYLWILLLFFDLSSPGKVVFRLPWER